MLGLPPTLHELTQRLARLPGVGPKAAERMALAVIKWEPAEARGLGSALSAAVERVSYCPQCGCLSQDHELCAVCSDTSRDLTMICVVENALDAIAIERGGGFSGMFHVLGGALSPIRGILPEDLRITELANRIRDGVVSELVVATNASPDGEATALYIRQEFAGSGVKMTRLARGLPSGGQLDYADAATLQSALDNRTEL